MYKENYKYMETTLTATAYNNKITIELPLDADASDYFQAFRTLMIGMTFSPEAFDGAVLQYVEEYNLLKELQNDHYDIDKRTIT